MSWKNVYCGPLHTPRWIQTWPICMTKWLYIAAYVHDNVTQSHNPQLKQWHSTRSFILYMSTPCHSFNFQQFKAMGWITNWTPRYFQDSWTDWHKKLLPHIKASCWCTRAAYATLATITHYVTMALNFSSGTDWMDLELIMSASKAIDCMQLSKVRICGNHGCTASASPKTYNGYLQASFYNISIHLHELPPILLRGCTDPAPPYS